MNLALITHSDCLKHSNGALHPEHAARLEAINDMLIARGLEPWFTQHLMNQAKRLTADR
jgi:acetoin utilization deacetylase AcuC-like enzyme